MKKTILLSAVLLSTAAGFAQESRQDVSISAMGLIGPNVQGNTNVYQRSTKTLGALVSYRYLLTPHSALEANYSFAQNTNYYQCCSNVTQTPVHTRQQELTLAYVYGLSFKRYNPFLEAGGGGIMFTPIQDGTGSLDAKQSTTLGGLFGGGLAYELTPSFDVRVQYRGIFVKAPSFVDTFKTNRYEVISEPAIGIAYHF